MTKTRKFLYLSQNVPFCSTPCETNSKNMKFFESFNFPLEKNVCPRRASRHSMKLCLWTHKSLEFFMRFDACKFRQIGVYAVYGYNFPLEKNVCPRRASRHSMKLCPWTHKSLEFDPRVEPHPELEKRGILLNASVGMCWKFMEYMNPSDP